MNFRGGGWLNPESQDSIGLLCLALILTLALIPVIYFGVFRHRVIQADGVVVQKTYHPSMNYHAVRLPTRVTMQEGFVLDIRVDGVSKPMHVNLNIQAGLPYDVGRRVRVRYEKRGIPPILSLYHVKQIHLLNDQRDDHSPNSSKNPVKRYSPPPPRLLTISRLDKYMVCVDWLSKDNESYKVYIAVERDMINAKLLTLKAHGNRFCVDTIPRHLVNRWLAVSAVDAQGLEGPLSEPPKILIPS